ncbi:galactonate dehydratase [Halosimplex halophilum]|uniref:galactonate dehydratase n=1 Tax=Halosimplex halophilum TaxID=2559572 RepID=UPI00107F95ED|nr:galactonate dehydratase [Halosimplex halophilum]
MEIRDYELFEVPPRSLLLKVETSDGLIGWGEPILEGRAQTAAAAVRELLDTYVVGEEAYEIERLWQKMYRSGFYRGGPILMSALSGIDQALWDLKGKSLGVPVYELLGGKARDQIRLYAHIRGETPTEAAEYAVERVEEGFTALKGAPGSRDWEHLDTPAVLDEARAHVGAVRDAVGDEIDLMFDFHGCPSKPMAKRLATALEEFDPMFYEELVVPEKNDVLPGIAAHTDIPLATGERMYSRFDFKPLLEAGAVDVIQPDVSHAGGITELRKIATMAEAYDVAVAPHSPLSAVALAACVQVDACTQNAIIQEQIVHEDRVPNYLADMSVFDHDDEGYIDIPEGPGLGIDVDEGYVREMTTEDAWDAPIVTRRDGSITDW